MDAGDIYFSRSFTMKLPSATFRKYLLIFTAVGSNMSLAAAAQENNEFRKAQNEIGSRWGVGLAAVSQQKPFKGMDRETIAIPVIYFENRYVQAFGPFADIKLHSLIINDSQVINFRIPIRYDLGGYDADEIRDTPVLNGMDERKGSFWSGAKVEWHNPIAKITAEWLHDLSGKSGGQQVGLAFERSWPIGKQARLTPRVVATWLDNEFIDYHYGVRLHEVRWDRAAYTGDSGVNIEYGVRGIYLFDQQNSVFLDLGATYLASGIKDSPLVDRTFSNSVLFGYRYQF